MAAARARRLYPGPIGDLIFEQLTSWDQMGFRFGGAKEIRRLIDFIMAQPLPGAEVVRPTGFAE